MPYIQLHDRANIDMQLTPIMVRLDFESLSIGSLSYIITKLLLRWLGGNKGYAAYASLVGMLVLTTLEFVRRAVNPYEDKKALENGDVYE